MFEKFAIYKVVSAILYCCVRSGAFERISMKLSLVRVDRAKTL